MEKKKKSQKVVEAFHDNKDFPSDVDGSYTGTDESFEKPVQDADDI